MVSAAQKCAGPQLAEVHLQALSDDESQRLIANLLEAESSPEVIGALILKKAEGNPFFVEEMIRMLVDRGVIVRKDSSWVTAKIDTETLHVPDNLQGLLLARIDRLPEAARQVVRVAAVIGRRFSASVIAEVLGQERVISWPEYLEAAGLIFRATTEPEQEFAFRHALVWEAAYNSLLLEERRQLHGAVGEALEHLYPEQLGELTGALAYHFAEASDTSRAFTYSTLAGDTAYQRYAVPEAIAHYTRALEIGRRTPQAVPEGAWRHLYTSRGRLLELDGRYEQALENYAEMEELARQRGDTAMELSATVEHARIHCEPNVSHDPVQGQALADRALALAQQTQDRAAEVRVHWVLMLLNWLTGNPASALAHGEASLALARELGLREQLAYTLHDIHRAYSNAGQRDEAKAALTEARRLWRDLGNLPMLADNLNSAADIAVGEGENDQALAFATEAFSISQSIGNLWNQAFARQIAGEVYVQQGLMDTAFETFRETLALSEQAGLVILNMRAALQQAWAYVYLGAAETAYERIARIRERFASPHSPFTAFYRVYGNLQIVLMYGRFGDWRMAEQVLAELLQSDVPASNQEQVRNTGNWYFARLLTALLRGDQEEIRVALQEVDANEWGRPVLVMQMQWHKGEGLLALGELEKSADCLHAALKLSQDFQDRQIEWQLLRLLKQIERRRGGSTDALTRTGREVISFIAEHVSDPELRATFLNRADVRELCAEG